MGNIALLRDRSVTTQQVIDYFGERALEGDPIATMPGYLVRHVNITYDDAKEEFLRFGSLTIEGYPDQPVTMVSRLGSGLFVELEKRFNTTICFEGFDDDFEEVAAERSNLVTIEIPADAPTFEMAADGSVRRVS